MTEYNDACLPNNSNQFNMVHIVFAVIMHFRGAANKQFLILYLIFSYFLGGGGSGDGRGGPLSSSQIMVALGSLF